MYTLAAEYVLNGLYDLRQMDTSPIDSTLLFTLHALPL